MMRKLSAVLFDVDGVLLDSLTPHLQICQDKNMEYNLGLSIPTAASFKKVVRQGVKVSPMKCFFEAVGFPADYADRAVAQYNQFFMRDYAPKPFPGVYELLSKLASEGLTLGMATANVRANVDSALAESMRFFHPQCIFTKDSSGAGTKTEALRAAARLLRVDTAETMYVGDQPADWVAAREAGARFLGVTYGWGICEDDDEFPVVNDVLGIAEHVLSGAR
jgi:phosphoglycolate phosphatase